MNLFLRTLDSSVPKNYTERRDKYHNLDIDDNVFSTFVGDFTIDFGPYVAVVIFVVFFFLVARAVRPRDGTVKSYQLLLLFCCTIAGGNKQPISLRPCIIKHILQVRIDSRINFFAIR